MYIIKVLNRKTGSFEEFTLAGKYARKERAEGALEAFRRIQGDLEMKVELVNPGSRGNVGRTEHGAALATAASGKVHDPARLSQLRASIAHARAAKAAKRAAVQEVVIKTKDARRDESVPPPPDSAVVDKVVISAEDVAKLIGSIRPGKPGSGEYILEVGRLAKTG